MATYEIISNGNVDKNKTITEHTTQLNLMAQNGWKPDGATTLIVVGHTFGLGFIGWLATTRICKDMDKDND